MDRSRKELIGVQCCNNCTKYKADKSNGYKMCYGICLISKSNNRRTDKCEKFIFRGQYKLI